MKKLLLLICTGLLFQLNVESATADTTLLHDARKFMQKAIKEGLEHLKYNPSDAMKIANNNLLFVGKCNICTSSKAGFDEYAKAPRIMMVQDFYSDTTILSKDTEKALKALEKLVASCVDYFYTQQQFTAAQKEKMQQLLTKEKQRSAMIAPGRFCASCEGSCKQPETD